MAETQGCGNQIAAALLLGVLYPAASAHAAPATESAAIFRAVVVLLKIGVFVFGGDNAIFDILVEPFFKRFTVEEVSAVVPHETAAAHTAAPAIPGTWRGRRRERSHRKAQRQYKRACQCNNPLFHVTSPFIFLARFPIAVSVSYLVFVTKACFLLAFFAELFV
jgi:glutathione S-transferase